MSMPYEELVAEYVKCAIKQGKVEELEKIKEDVERDKKMFFYDEGMQKAYANSIEIINSHISELKGE